MALHRLTTLTVGVPDVATTGAFYVAFGLGDLGDGRFATRDGGEQLRLVTAPTRGPQRIGLGVDDGDDLGRLARRLADHGLPCTRDDDGLQSTEPVTGVAVDVTVAPRLAPPTHALPPVNTPAEVPRRDRPAEGVLRAGPVRPSNLTHLVLGSPDQPATLAFFTEALGFEISDEVPGIVAFTRCGEVHHNLAVQAAPAPMLHHVAFEVDDVDEVARAGTELTLADPDRHLWGLGRHAIGSNWFWYLKDPSGHFVEYTADVDRIGAQELYAPRDWSGHEFLYAFGPPPPPEFFAPAA
jgi:catechol 2,3-dioxygenase-like lactoylglutathione lyase family enzyme